MMHLTQMSLSCNKSNQWVIIEQWKHMLFMVQGLSIPFACVGSGDPVRVLRLYAMDTLDTLWSIYCWGICTTCRYWFYCAMLKPYALSERSQSYRLSDLLKSRCSWPIWVKFYIFQFKQSSTQWLVEEWTKYNQASSVNCDNIYIRINFKKIQSIRANQYQCFQSILLVNSLQSDLVVDVHDVLFVLSNKYQIHSGNWK